MTLSAPQKEQITLVTFSYDDSSIDLTYTETLSYKRFTDSGKVYTSGADTWSPVPSMSVRLPAATGQLDQNMAVIELPLVPVAGDVFVQRASSGEPFPPTKVVIQQVATAKGTITTSLTVTLFEGRLVRATRSSGARVNAVKFEIAHCKAFLNVPLGIPATPICAWTLGGAGCGANTQAVGGHWAGAGGPFQAHVIRELISIDGTHGGLDTGLTNFNVNGGKLYHRGFARRGGLRIGIRDWDYGAGGTGPSDDPAQVYFVRQPPSWWLNQDLVFEPGCDGSQETCSQRYNNHANFGGLGIAIPNYQPNFEVPDA